MLLIGFCNRPLSVLSSFVRTYLATMSVCGQISNYRMNTHSIIEKVVEQLLRDPNIKIQEFVVAFKALRQDLDTGTLQQNTLITSRISDQVDILGTYM